MKEDRYVLDENGNPKVEKDLLTWARWFEINRESRIVKRTKVKENEVSTVFLGLDHSFGASKPVLWETMVFPACVISQRYSSEEDAIAGHDEIVNNLTLMS